MEGSGVSRRVPITAFGGEIWCPFGAGITLPGPLREAPSRHPRPLLSIARRGTTNA
jgi:hypothetical protein